MSNSDIQEGEPSAPGTTSRGDSRILTVRENEYMRDYRSRPLFRLSVELIDTYKRINQTYYETRAAALAAQQDDHRGGEHNDGYDDSSYDYIIRGDEIFADRYIIKHRIGKGSFGQVFCAYDRLSSSEVAIKIIKSKRPFLVQAQTEIEILNLLYMKDREDEHNIVRLLDTFVYRNHQCLIFEMLSHNLYDLLKNTRFRGISLNLIRKFSRQILNALDFLSQTDIDVIHCDLKPENILLKHPRRSAIKLIDFGSSCFSNGRTYTYIQSRFYRSPEVLLGIPYDHKIDLWSLACVLTEMHCGEPLFGGQDQVDQICRIVDVLGMPPISMLERSPSQYKNKFFEKITAAQERERPIAPDRSQDVIRSDDGSFAYVLLRPAARPRDAPSKRTLADIIGVTSGGPGGRRVGEVGHSRERYEEFHDFISHMLEYEPLQRASAFEALLHPFLTAGGGSEMAVTSPNSAVPSPGGPYSRKSIPSSTMNMLNPSELSSDSLSEVRHPSQNATSSQDPSAPFNHASFPGTAEQSSLSGQLQQIPQSRAKRKSRRFRSRSAPSTQPELIPPFLPSNKKSSSKKSDSDGTVTEASLQENHMNSDSTSSIASQQHNLNVDPSSPLDLVRQVLDEEESSSVNESSLEGKPVKLYLSPSALPTTTTTTATTTSTISKEITSINDDENRSGNDGESLRLDLTKGTATTTSNTHTENNTALILNNGSPQQSLVNR